MPSEQEIQFHRSFLSLPLSLAIWNEDQRYSATRGGPPNRQRKIESDPVFAYHVHSGPKYPNPPPGRSPDRKYNALLARNDGSLESLVIVTKRGMSGQKFALAATPWELTKSVMCGGMFNPIVNSMMEVTGHYARIAAEDLLRPKGINFRNPSEYIANDVPLHLWMHRYSGLPAPEGWAPFRKDDYLLEHLNGGIDVLVLPNGDVIGAKGIEFDYGNNGHAVSVMSPFDFWSPGSRMAAAAIRGLTNRVSAAAVKGFHALRGPTKELAKSTVARLSGKALTGNALSTGTLPFQQAGRRTIIMGADMAKMQTAFAALPTPPKTYDVVIHGDDFGFYILVSRIPLPDPKKVKNIYRKASVREVANLIRPHLAPGDEIRLLACTTGNPGGPAQLLANELAKHKVWAPEKTVANRHGVFREENGELVQIAKANAFVPLDGGKFWEFIPERGAVTLAGKGGKVPGNVVKGEINPARSK